MAGPLTLREARCDLVIPVHNALKSTRNCLESVRRFAPPWARVVVINDRSDDRTTAWLEEQSDILVLHNAWNLGFVASANRGMSFSEVPYVCLLNSDTLLTEGALERMVARLDRDGSIGLCCPLSNNSMNLSVNIPPGEDVFTFARRVAATSPAIYPDVTTVVGFCLLIRRSVIQTVGLFDEIFGLGYCEESDYHYRALSAGWRAVVADDAFVYHKQGASFIDGNERMHRNLEIFRRRWQWTHGPALEEFDRRDAMGAFRDRESREWILPPAGEHEPFDVLFVLPMMGVFGGVADVLEVVNALILEGVRAGVVVLENISPEINLEIFFRPIRISADDLAAKLPKTRVLVATAYQTASVVAEAAAANPGTQTAYFVQDYEGWFGQDGPEVVGKTYELIPRITVISTWLKREIEARHGITSTVVPMSADPEVFYPRGNRAKQGPIRIVAMLRPEERRGKHILLPALERLWRHADESGHAVEFQFFGVHGPEPGEVDFPYHHNWALSRDGVARLLSSAHVVVDPSLFQGFGLVGIEGMASGAACVLTRSGGAEEYAEDGVNSLLVPAGDVDALTEALIRVVDDDTLREKLAERAIESARRFTWQAAARKYIAFLDTLPKASA
ncbi:MAG: glycosyltransferase [Thermoanaerobaculia bacterium]|jgi:GT2 family glycosyltransferase